MTTLRVATLCNAEPDSDEIRFLRGPHVADGESVHFADAWMHGGDGSAGATFSSVNEYARRTREPSRRIDYIFTSAWPATSPCRRSGQYRSSLI